MLNTNSYKNANKNIINFCYYSDNLILWLKFQVIIQIQLRKIYILIINPNSLVFNLQII